MKKYFMAGLGISLAATVAAVVYAQVTIQVEAVCDKLDTVLALIRDRYGETPVIMSQSKDTTVAFMGNNKTGSWTIIQFNREMACIIGSGERYQLITGTKI